MGILSVIQDNVEIVTDEGGWVRAGVVQVGHYEVARPGIPIVERHEGRACRRDRLVVWISIVGGVVGVLAAEQQVWSDEVGGPGCVDRVEEIVCGDRVDVWV